MISLKLFHGCRKRTLPPVWTTQPVSVTSTVILSWSHKKRNRTSSKPWSEDGLTSRASSPTTIWCKSIPQISKPWTSPKRKSASPRPPATPPAKPPAVSRIPYPAAKRRLSLIRSEAAHPIPRLLRQHLRIHPENVTRMSRRIYNSIKIECYFILIKWDAIPIYISSCIWVKAPL